jgi:hypothetical protein
MSRMTEQLDVLGSPEPVRRTPVERSRGQVLVTGVAALTVLLTGVSYAGYQAIAPHGHAPEDALPAETVAFAKVDLDPSPSQKLAVYRLSKRFPKTHVKSDRSVRDDLLADVFKAAGEDVDYANEIKPWIGDRAAIGALPGTDEPHPVVAVQFHDRAKARKGVEHLKDVDTADDLYYAFSDVDDYVLLSDDQGVVDRAAHAKRHLADERGFRSAVSSLHGDQIVTAWADLAKVFALMPADALQDNPLFSVKDLKVQGQYVLGAHAEDDAIELDMHEIGAKTGVAGLDGLQVGQGSGSDLVQGFPSDAVAAIGVTGLGASLATGYEQVRKALTDADSEDLLSTVAKAGLHLPGDLRTVFGDEVAGYVSGSDDDPRAVLHVKTAHADAAKAVLAHVVRAVEQFSGEPAPAGFLDAVFRKVSDGYVVGFPESALTAKPSGRLGSTEVFRKAVPDAHGAPFVLFVNIGELASRFDAGDSGPVAHLQAFGMTQRVVGNDATARLRLTFR